MCCLLPASLPRRLPACASATFVVLCSPPRPAHALPPAPLHARRVRETGKQVYLGGYELEEHAAEAYDVAALKCKGIKVKTNFPVQKYLELMSYLDTVRVRVL